jgi:hypothetical protein
MTREEWAMMDRLIVRLPKKGTGPPIALMAQRLPAAARI